VVEWLVSRDTSLITEMSKVCDMWVNQSVSCRHILQARLSVLHVAARCDQLDVVKWFVAHFPFLVQLREAVRVGWVDPV
jgi:hypothetical protein